MQTLMKLLTLATDAAPAAESKEPVSTADVFFPTPFGMNPFLFILLLLVVGTAIIATIVSMKVKSKRRRATS
ncbi:MAG: hypothetical protein GC159_12525 [Phycisphaera sp.]|nr:hypothetical protein [Phycisphaera sp.]